MKMGYKTKYKKPIDVILLTKNSECMLRNCLDSLYSNVPVNRLIVVDGYSSDNTLQILKEYPKVLIVFDDGTRATARQKGIKMIETEWFMFLDSDVVLKKGWFDIVTSLIQPHIGGVQGRELPIFEELDEIADAIATLKRRFGFPVKKTIFGWRAFMGDTLIRTEAVKDIRIPPWLHVYEDNYIQRYIVKRGFKWVETKEHVCLHHGRPYQKQGLILAGIYGYLEGYLTFKKTLFSTLVCIPKAIIVTLYTKKMKYLKFIIYRQFLTFIGVMKAWCRK
jgi:glycosyltransferase involved in cell wall biosynthesis